jgi:ornithine carbamoyltransferase
MCHSYINAARQWGFKLNIACPEGYDPEQSIFDAAGDQVEIIRDPMAAATDSDLIVTDVWTSMGQEEEKIHREIAFNGYFVDDKLMAQANNDALFMHCLPAHRGEEVSASVIDGKQSVVWDEAGNRLHAQKALLEFLMGKTNY